MMRSIYLALACIFSCTGVFSQIPEGEYSSSIHTIQFYEAGNQVGVPVIRLGGIGNLELHFDDLDPNIKNISYTFMLCNADWTPTMLSQFDYIKGFSQNRITNYRVSSLANTRYIHYQALVPDRNCYPSRSGNYILKVFVNGDTSKLLFTRRMLVVDSKTNIGAQIQQPYNGLIFKTHQKINFKVNLAPQLDIVNPYQQVSVSLLQNFRWDNMKSGLRPSFFSRTTIDYNTEADAVFPAGKEFRWVDLRSFRFQSDRIAKVVADSKTTDVFLKTDMERSQQRVNFYRDANGRYTIDVTESINPLWQADYATIHFSYAPAGNNPLNGKDVYLFGALTNFRLDDNSKMTYNAAAGVYEANVLLKQGYYDYVYVTVDAKDKKRQASFEFTEGDYWESENQYTILMYYRPLGGRADELIGYTTVNSLTDRKTVGR
jgi:hypothetical protein